jgi:hypothetical protein
MRNSHGIIMGHGSNEEINKKSQLGTASGYNSKVITDEQKYLVYLN